MKGKSLPWLLLNCYIFWRARSHFVMKCRWGSWCTTVSTFFFVCLICFCICLLFPVTINHLVVYSSMPNILEHSAAYKFVFSFCGFVVFVYLYCMTARARGQDTPGMSGNSGGIWQWKDEKERIQGDVLIIFYKERKQWYVCRLNSRNISTKQSKRTL